MDDSQNTDQNNLTPQNHPLKTRKLKTKTKTRMRNKNNLRQKITILPIHLKLQQETEETENHLLLTQEQEEIQTIQTTRARAAQTALLAQTTKIIIFTQSKSLDEKEEEQKTSSQESSKTYDHWPKNPSKRLASKPQKSLTDHGTSSGHGTTK